MDDYRSAHATPGQIDSLWAMIGTLRRQVEDLTERLNRVETEPSKRALATAAVSGDASLPR